MPERITFKDENSSSTFELQLLHCLPFILEINQQGKTFPLSTTLNKALLLTHVNQNNLYIKIQIPFCSKMQDSLSIRSCRDGSCKDWCCRRACAPERDVTLEEPSDHQLQEAASGWAGKTFPS